MEKEDKKETEEIVDVLKIFINDLDVDLVLCGEDDDIKRIRNYLSIQSKNNDNKIDIIRLVERITNYTKLRGNFSIRKKKFVGQRRKYMLKLLNGMLIINEAFLPYDEMEEIIMGKSYQNT